MLYTLTLGLAPVSFLFTYIYLKDKVEPEPLGMLVLSFLLGGLTVIPAGIIEYNAGMDAELLQEMQGMTMISFIFLVVAPAEEFAKYFVLRYLIYPRSAFSEPFDGIMYGVAVSLGFAAVENVMFLLTFGHEIGWIRMVSAIPLHCLTGVFMGFYMGLAKYETDLFKQKKLLFKSLMAAILVHGLYDVAALSGDSMSWLALFSVLLICANFARMAIKQLQQAKI